MAENYLQIQHTWKISVQMKFTLVTRHTYTLDQNLLVTVDTCKNFWLMQNKYFCHNQHLSFDSKQTKMNGKKLQCILAHLRKNLPDLDFCNLCLVFQKYLKFYVHTKVVKIFPNDQQLGTLIALSTF